MTFSVDDFQDLVRLLEQRPEWRAELRRLVLTRELLDLPAMVRELTEAHLRAEARLSGVEDRLAKVEDRLARVEDRLAKVEDRVGNLETAVAALVAAQQRTEEEIRALVAAQRDFTDRQQDFARVQEAMRDQLGDVRGDLLELRYREHAGGYFGPLLRRARVVSADDLDTLLEEGIVAAALDEDTAHDVRLADVVVRGRRRGEDHDTYLVVEVSAGIGPGDVERAARRAGLLSRLRPTVPVVAGEWVTPEAEALVEAHRVWRVLDGRILAPNGA